MLTLASVRRAISGLQAEVFVVDNASPENVVQRVSEGAPWVKLIAMSSNAGFPGGNNVALRQCSGRCICVLNPDTIVSPSFFSQLVAFVDQHPESGAIGVNMINGQGRYLRESKRGYTDLRTSFFKLSGLWRLNPSSPVLNAYYIGQCSEDDSCHAPVLSGACMSFSRSLYQRVGGFDEDFFMYSEDIDLSWRMDRASQGNVYLGNLRIVHFKGQSTPRQKKYLGYFYDSMLIFARKYEFPKHGALVNFFTHLGIRTAYLFSLVKSCVLRHVERSRSFCPPHSLVFVSQSQQHAQVFGSRIAPGSQVSVVQSVDHIPHDAAAVVVDLDFPLLDEFLTFMRTHEGRSLFGFFNPDQQQALVFFNNRCHDVLARH